MNIKIKLFLVLVTLFLLLTPQVLAKKDQERIKIGANLSNYSIPNKKNCDIKVPKDYITIQAGIDAAAIGDTICVGKGIYNEDVKINKSVKLSGNGSKNHKSVIQGQTAGLADTVIISADDVTIEGFVIKGVGADYTSGAIRIGESSSNVNVQYNHIISGNGELALLSDGFQQNNMIKHNILEGNNSPQVAFINGTPSVGKASDKVDFINNTFEGAVSPTTRQDTGVVLTQHATSSLIMYNVFNTSGTVMELVQNAYASGNSGLNYNNFNSPAQLWKVSNGVDILNAENNWWGDIDPSDDVRNSQVDFTPFELSPFKEF